MKIKNYKSEDATVLALDGMLDTSSSDAFNEKVVEVLASGGAVCVDMAELEYISSRGVREILTLIKKMKESGNPLSFTNIRPAVREIFDLSGLSAVMDIK